MRETGGTFRSDPPRFVLALLVLVTGFALWQLASRIGDSADDEIATTTSTLVPADLDLDALDRGWVRIDLPGRARLTTLALVDATLFAAGGDEQAERAEVWRSTNGREWQRVADPAGIFANATVAEFAALEGAVVAVGSRIVPGESGGVVRPAVWRSGDGETFGLVPDNQIEMGPGADSPAGDAGAMTDVVGMDGRLVAVGWQASGVVVGPGPGAGGAVWVSETGETWFRIVPDPADVDDRGTVIASVDVVPGGLVAAGRSGGRAVVWESTDALVWNRLSDELANVFSGDGDWAASAIAASGESTVALGSAADADVDELRLWAASEQAWTRLDIPELEDVMLSAVSPLPPGFVAAGARHLPDERVTAGLWASPDGADWSRIDIEDVPLHVSVMTDVVVHPAGVVAVGAVFDQPAVWYRPRAEAEIEEVAAGAPLPPPAWATVFQELEASQTTPGALRRVGGLIYGVSDERWIWYSEDGRSWIPTEFEEAGLSDAEHVLAIVHDGRTWAAIGEEETPGVWVSDDGIVWGRPAKAPPCCIRALFPMNAGGFRGLGQDPADGAWFLTSSEDGFTWSVNSRLPNLAATELWRTEHHGAVDMVWAAADGVPTGQVWSSTDGFNWAAANADGVLRWSGVWRAGDRVLAAAETSAGSTLLETNGVEWDVIALPGVDLDTGSISDVAALPGALAVLVSAPNQSQRLYVVPESGPATEVALDGAHGFGGLQAVLVPDLPQLRVLGPDHGRLTVWEWVPAE